MTDIPSNIWKKISLVMADITHMGKSGWNAHFSYAYATDEDVLSAVHESLVTHGLIILPGMVEVIQDNDKTLARFEFQIVDIENGESITLPWHGEANDKQDKGVSKAATSAVKYFLLKLLLIPTGDKSSDPDAGGDDTTPGHRAHTQARNDGKPGDMVIKFAPKDKTELRGKTIAQLWDLDRGWVEYLAKNAKETTIKVAASAYMKAQVDDINPSSATIEPDLTPPTEWRELWTRSVTDLGFNHQQHAMNAYRKIFPEATKDNPPAIEDAWAMLIQHQAEANRP